MTDYINNPYAAYPGNLFIGTKLADSAIGFNKCVKKGTNAVDVAVAGADETFFGVAVPKSVEDADDSYADNEQVTIQVAGVAMCIASQAVTAGDYVDTHTGGTVISVAADANRTVNNVGMALESAANGAKVPVLLK
jgi:hydrogenase maturation factor